MPPCGACRNAAPASFRLSEADIDACIPPQSARSAPACGPDEKRIPRFSNLQHKYPDENGVVTGVPGEAPSDSPDGPADAARSLNETRRVVANYRRSVPQW